MPTAAPPKTRSLAAHPQTPAPAGLALDVCVQLAAADRLQCRYELRGDLSQVRWPVAQGGERRDELWRHTCCEVFLGAAGVSDYYEFNFAPGLDWACYQFSAYRAGRSDAVAQAPRLTVRRDAERFELSAQLALGDLAALAASRTLQLAVAAVVEDLGGGLSYWALRHPHGQPDFHHRSTFTLEVARP